MKVSGEVDWNMINNIVQPNHQYKEVSCPPLDSVRMAWPFKTEAELAILSKWFKKEQKLNQERVVKRHIEKYGKAFL